MMRGKWVTVKIYGHMAAGPTLYQTSYGDLDTAPTHGRAQYPSHTVRGRQEGATAAARTPYQT